MNIKDVVEIGKSLKGAGLGAPAALLAFNYFYKIFPISPSGRPWFEISSFIMTVTAYIFGTSYAWSLPARRFAPEAPKSRMFLRPIVAFVASVVVLFIYAIIGQHFANDAPESPWLFDYAPIMLGFLGGLGVSLFFFCLISSSWLLHRIAKEAQATRAQIPPADGSDVQS